MSFKILKYKNQLGQKGFSLMEVIAALAIFSILTAGVFYVATNSYRNFFGAGDRQQVAKFAQEGLSAARAIRDNSWQAIEDAAGQGALGASKDSGGNWQFAGTSDSLGVLSRTVEIEDVYRDESGNIVSEGGSLDLNTYKVIVTVSGPGISDYVLSAYLSNWSYQSWRQSDWSGNGARAFWSEADMFSTVYSNVSTSTPSQLDLSFSPGSYNYRRTITIDNTKVSGDLSHVDFPMLVSLTEDYLKSTANGGKVESANGYDIIFTSDEEGANQLSHEIERYNPATGELIAWVKIPALPGNTDTIIYMFYGNGDISTSQEDVYNTWDDYHIMVYHKPDGSSSAIKNSANANNQGTKKASGEPVEINGRIGKAQDYDGSNDYVNIPHHSSQLLTSGMTISVWMKPDTLGGASSGRIIDKSNGSSAQAGWVLFCQSTYVSFTAAGALIRTSASGSINYNGSTWYHVVVTVAANGTTTFYINGVQSGSVGATNALSGITSTSGVRIGNRSNATDRAFDGIIDELKVSNILRNVDWIKTEYNNQSSPSTFFAVGAEEEMGLSGYNSPGYIYSSIFDLGASDKELRAISVSQDVPAGCSVSVDLEADNSSSFASPVAHTFSDNGSSYASSTPDILNGYRYLRYKATLTACNGNADTPTLYSLKIDYR
ncbi:MAG: DUF2341 domain-containing protein [Patescibacteria group bacterium]|nr:DUF2341 domain-containing protein [Patescibacteria group bacterium]